MHTEAERSILAIRLEHDLSGSGAKLDAVAQEPLVRAVLDRFPGAEIVGVHDRPRDAEITPEPPEDSA